VDDRRATVRRFAKGTQVKRSAGPRPRARGLGRLRLRRLLTDGAAPGSTATHPESGRMSRRPPGNGFYAQSVGYGRSITTFFMTRVVRGAGGTPRTTPACRST